MQKDNLWKLELGANQIGTGTNFLVFAPKEKSLSVEVEKKGQFLMQKKEPYFSLFIEGVKSSDCYWYLLNGQKRADPVSRSLPKAVNGPTEIIDPSSFSWTDQDWKGIEFDQMVFYELHVGCFTPQGNFDGVVKKLFYLKDLGITCIELMPIAQFYGKWNWGYDGVSLYAPHIDYGGYEGLKRLVDACHQLGIAVCLDVVYSHLGPEGNYLPEFGPYFSKEYRSPWGDLFNFDGPYSDDVRYFLISNALYWVSEFHIDCLRLDALHSIIDCSVYSFMEELSDKVKAYEQKSGRKIYLVGENDRNDARLIRKKTDGGFSMQAVWNDDFHHSLHTFFTKEKQAYYEDFLGFPDLFKTFEQNFLYGNSYSTFRKRTQGSQVKVFPKSHFVVFSQNHDQIGNRPKGERLLHISHLPIELEPYFVLLNPSIPLLFMGQEYGETEPFCYFADFPKELMEKIHEGRKKEFSDSNMIFPGQAAYHASMLSWKINEKIFAEYKTLLAIRKKYLPRKEIFLGNGFSVYQDPDNSLLAWEYQTQKEGKIQVVVNCSKKAFHYSFPFQPGMLLHALKNIEIKDEMQFEEKNALVFYHAH